MDFRSCLRKAILSLLVGALLLPMVVGVLAGGAALVGAMGDSCGRGLFRGLAVAGGLLWVVDLLFLTLATATWCLVEADRGE